ncbi:class I SAM-dependent methyltransferase [Roseateles amylovorans]|uniref:Class I SAM-dependent methyltransferase n=1 Tax=Roseateles amylovorans TaxID=2978473 RepID=A0ABY6B336_9BURK|nr:class I SAM-dependent methyltransferase [Roseateles amylovorans]UXH79803.1 class I SAM-dependent methyltransferase [Roseateles amylovorans]
MVATASPWRWPLLALLSWAACWAVWRGFGPGWPAALAACGLGLVLAAPHRQSWRRLIVAAGFPLALVVTGAALPAWSWLIALVLLLLAYPRRGWTDAPLYPTPHDALRGLPQAVPLPDGARVLDAGCGIGDGLMALRRAYPRVRLEGIEYSAVLWLLARLRCPWARLSRGDLWAQSWAEMDLVYLFQRPESMPRALDKALAELAPDSWLVSLDFPLPGQRVHAQLETGTRHRVHVYRMRDLRTART